jgi:geranylgeranyl pyrophosphate synthase
MGVTTARVSLQWPTVDRLLRSRWQTCGLDSDVANTLARVVSDTCRPYNADRGGADKLRIQAHLWALPLLFSDLIGGRRHARLYASTGAWTSLYVAAKLMDDCQDGASDNTAAALNLSSILFATTGMLIAGIRDRCLSNILHADYCVAIARAARGQLREFESLAPSVDTVRDIATEKSGALFSYAALTAARVCAADRLTTYRVRELGRLLGELLQLNDDAQDFLTADGRGHSDTDLGMRWTLPVSFAVEAIPGDGRDELIATVSSLHALATQCRADASDQTRMEQVTHLRSHVRRVVSQSGAPLYLASLAESKWVTAMVHLRSLNGDSRLRLPLESLFEQLRFQRSALQ